MFPYLDTPEGDTLSSAGCSHTWTPLKVTPPPLQDAPIPGVWGRPASELPSLTLQTCLSDWALGSGTFNFRGCKIIVGSCLISKLVLSGGVTLAKFLGLFESQILPTVFFLPGEDNRAVTSCGTKDCEALCPQTQCLESQTGEAGETD